MPEVVADRNFRLWIAGEAVSVLGDRMVAIALAFAVLGLGGSPAEVGLVLAGFTLPTVALLPFGGVVGDRLSRRAVMVSADVARLVSQGTLAALLISDSIDVAGIVILAAVTGAATGFFRPASTGLLPAVVPPALLQQANGIRATVNSAGEILGPAVAGVIIATTSPGWALAIDAATFAVSAVLLAVLRLPGREPAPPSRFLSDLREGWTAFRSRRWVWSVVAGAATANLVWGAWSALGPIVAERDLGGAAAWGTVLATMGVGALAGSLVATRTAARAPLVIVVSAYLSFGVPLALLAVGGPVWALALGALVAGAGMMLGNSVWETTLQRHVPAASLSRVSAYDWFGSLAFYPLGVALWGPVASIIGTAAALWLASAVLVAVWLAILTLPDIRRFEPAAATE